MDKLPTDPGTKRGSRKRRASTELEQLQQDVDVDTRLQLTAVQELKLVKRDRDRMGAKCRRLELENAGLRAANRTLRAAISHPIAPSPSPSPRMQPLSDPPDLPVPLAEQAAAGPELLAPVALDAKEKKVERLIDAKAQVLGTWPVPLALVVSARQKRKQSAQHHLDSSELVKLQVRGVLVQRADERGEILVNAHDVFVVCGRVPPCNILPHFRRLFPGHDSDLFWRRTKNGRRKDVWITRAAFNQLASKHWIPMDVNARRFVEGLFHVAET